MNTGKVKKLLFAALLSVAVLGSVSAQERSGSATRRVGLFIGSNNGGRGRVLLRYAVSDAKAVSGVFGDMGGINRADNILLVEPTVTEINRRLDAMHRDLSSSRSNYQRTELVFYYSGHSDEEGLLLNRERYGYRELRERINRIDTDMRIVILDSCSSGAITRAKGGVKAPPFLFDSSVSAEGYAFLTSSSADEASQESDSIESSYFTHSLVAGLRGAADTVGDGKVTLNELYRFAYTETLASTETSLYGAQHPSYDMQISGSGDVVLTDIKETSASLLIDGELTGRITIRDESDFLVAELTKANRKPMELGLEPGLYRITIQKGDSFYRAGITLRENVRTSLTMEDFSLIASSSGNRSRGDELSADTPAQADAPGPEPAPRTLYTFFVNFVYEPFPYPLIGFVNIARGNHRIFQLGFVNWNTGRFSGFEAGFVNTIGKDLYGVQASFVNTVAANTNGMQWGFVNTTAGNVNGAQGGFVNTVAGSINGAQFGFINTAAREIHGLQFGFINTSAQKIRGVQFGFINYADSAEGGIPVGFVSIVRHGGYHAVEFGFSEFYPFNIGIKLGVEKFYTTISASYTPFDADKQEPFAVGFGIGSIIPVVKSFFINPELNISSPINDDYHLLAGLVPSFGFKLGKHFSISAGPSVTWVYNHKGKPQQPFFSIYKHSIDDNHSIVVGARAAMRVIF